MADKNNYRFMRLMQMADVSNLPSFWRNLYNEHPDMKTTNEEPGPVPDWVRELWKYGEALKTWFHTEKGNKDHFIPKIVEMASCKNRAPWASWSGKAWRGLTRSVRLIATYKMTDKIDIWGGRYWLIGMTSYKSKYAIQSWTTRQKNTLEFAEQTVMTPSTDFGVVLETNITKEEGFLSPEITNTNVFEEFEVIRISNKETIVKAYVDVQHIVQWLTRQIDFDDKKKYPNLSFLPNSKSPSLESDAINILAPVFGHALAKKLMAPKHAFRVKFDSHVKATVK
jgi:hypothetical protein